MKISIGITELVRFIKDESAKERCNFVTHRSSSKKRYYYCHRSGPSRSRSQGIRLPKAQGSNKTGFFCPALITVEQTGRGLKVRYQKNHQGHDDNIGHLNLTREERVMIHEKLKSGIPLETVLDVIRENSTDLSTPLSLINMKDLHNIKRDFQLFDDRKDHNDFVSVHKMVNCLNERDDKTIRYFRVPESQLQADTRASSFMLVLATDFQLTMLKKFGDKGTICLDSTHGTAGYGYSLTSIVVIDDFGNGMATAFCLSSNTSRVEWKDFLEAILKAMDDIKITARVLMTDNDASFYNAWVEVMGPVQHRLLCSWHIDQAWRRNLGKVNNKYN